MNFWKKTLGGLLTCAMLLSPLSLFATAEEGAEGKEEGAPEVLPYEEYAERFDGKTLADVAVVNGDTPSSAQIIVAPVDADAHGAVLQMDMSLNTPDAYYLWKDRNNKWPISGVRIDANGLLSGIANGIEIQSQPINKNDTAKTFQVGGVTYAVVTGAYAEAQGGYLGNVSQPLILKNGALSARDGYFTVSMDVYLSTDFAIKEGITGRISVLDTNGAKVRLELFRITSLYPEYGYGSFEKHGNSDYCDGGAVDIELGRWHTLSFVIDRSAARVTAILDGTYAFAAENNSKNSLSGKAAFPLSLAPDSLELEISRINAPSDLDGFFQVDHVAAYHGEVDGGYEKGSIAQSFESVALGSAPTNGIYSIEVEGSFVDNVHGSKAWSIPMSEANAGAFPNLANEKYVYSSAPYVAISADYFIEASAKGALTGRVKTITAFIGASATSATRVKEGIGLYLLSFAGDGNVTLSLEGAGASAPDAVLNETLTLSADAWIEIDALIDLVGGTYDLYVDGTCVMEDIPFYKGTDRLTKLTLNANSVVLGGVASGAEAYEGTVQLDNVMIYSEEQLRVPTESAPYAEDFETFAERIGFYLRGAQLPALASYVAANGGTAVHLALGTLRTDDGYALLEDDASSVLSYDVLWDPERDDAHVTVPGNYFAAEEEYEVAYNEELGLYTVTIDLGYIGEPDIHTYYIVPNGVAEGARNGVNIGRGISFAHGIYSYKSTAGVVLEADYYLASGSRGTISSTLEGFLYGNTEDYGASLVTFWSADAATGSIEGTDAALTVDAWNNVKIFLDLTTGEYSVYLNGRCIATRDCGRTEITFGFDKTSEWNVVLSAPCTVEKGANVGSVMIDNVSVATEIPEARSQYDESFLTDADYFAYLAGALMMQDAASIRLENPCGLRFTTKIDEVRWEMLSEHFTVSDMGTLILPADVAAGVESLTRETLDALGGTAYLDIKYEEDFDGAAGHSFEEGRYFTASIVQIKKENLARDFVGVSYVTLTLADGATVTLYSSAAIANAAATAEAALARTDVEWTDAQREILVSLSEA